jgi:hypothetical protein
MLALLLSLSLTGQSVLAATWNNQQFSSSLIATNHYVDTFAASDGTIYAVWMPQTSTIIEVAAWNETTTSWDFLPDITLSAIQSDVSWVSNFGGNGGLALAADGSGNIHVLLQGGKANGMYFDGNGPVHGFYNASLGTWSYGSVDTPANDQQWSTEYELVIDSSGTPQAIYR